MHISWKFKGPPLESTTPPFLVLCRFLALPTKAKDIVFRLIVEYSSLKDLGP
jgi:hypothetical protein